MWIFAFERKAGSDLSGESSVLGIKSLTPWGESSSEVWTATWLQHIFYNENFGKFYQILDKKKEKKTKKEPFFIFFYSCIFFTHPLRVIYTRSDPREDIFQPFRKFTDKVLVNFFLSWVKFAKQGIFVFFIQKVQFKCNF